MSTLQDKKALFTALQKDILQWEGYKPAPAGVQELIGLGPVEAAFPNGVFPRAAVHEMVCTNTEQATASSGLIAGLLSVLMQNSGVGLWISLTDHLFPSSLKSFGLEADRLIFIRVAKDKEALWVMEEALKCSGLSAVVAEVHELDFKQSRRLQLAIEQSQVTGFILRNCSDKIGSTACTSRWQVTSLPSEPIDDLPGLGFPRWKVDLLRVRNGQPGSWTLEWAEGKFKAVTKPAAFKLHKQKVG